MLYFEAYDDENIEKLLQELGLKKGEDQDYEMIRNMMDDIPDLTICEMLRAINIESIDPESQEPVPGYRDAWLAIQAAALRKGRDEIE